MVLPGMSGADLAAHFSRERPESRVHFTSGYADESIVEAGVLAGGGQLRREPYSPAELTRRVREALDRAIA